MSLVVAAAGTPTNVWDAVIGVAKVLGVAAVGAASALFGAWLNQRGVLKEAAEQRKAVKEAAAAALVEADLKQERAAYVKFWEAMAEWMQELQRLMPKGDGRRFSARIMPLRPTEEHHALTDAYARFTVAAYSVKLVGDEEVVGALRKFMEVVEAHTASTWGAGVLDDAAYRTTTKVLSDAMVRSLTRKPPVA